MADEDLDLLFSFIKPKNKYDIKRIHNITCDFCSSDLLIDYTNNMNVCPKCAIGYDFFDYTFRPCYKSPPYKRKWHLMTSVQKLGVSLRHVELDSLLADYLKLDRAYSKHFPGKNMVNLKYAIRFILIKNGYESTACDININCSSRTAADWEGKLNLAFSKC